MGLAPRWHPKYAVVFLLAVGAALVLSWGGAARAQSVNWTGTWDTRTGAGNQYIFKFNQSGSSVSGTARHGGGTVFTLSDGVANGNVLTFRIDIGGGLYNRYEFVMGGDGNSFTGRWGYDTDPPGVYNGGTWSGRRAPLIHFKVDTHARNVRGKDPPLKWFQLGVSRLNGGGYIEPNGLVSGERPIKLFQYIKSPSRPHRPFTVDGSVQWRILGGQVVSKDVRLNFGDRSLTRVYRLTLDAVASQSVLFDRCPLGTRARIILLDDARRLKNGETRDRAEVRPIGSNCPGPTQGWSNKDGPNFEPPRGGLRQGQHAQVDIRERSIH
jgi:hypothetical protein